MKKVYGLIIIALLTFSCSDSKKEIIGKWIDSSQHGTTMIIYREGNSVYVENKYGQQTNSIQELTEEKVGVKLRYVEKEGGDLAKSYVIDPDHLRVYNDQGLIMSYRKMK